MPDPVKRRPSRALGHTGNVITNATGQSRSWVMAVSVTTSPCGDAPRHGTAGVRGNASAVDNPRHPG